MAIHPNVAIHDAIIKSGKVVLSSLYFVFGVGLHLRGYEARKYILPVFAWQERGEQAAAKGRAIAARHIDRGKQQIAAARELPQESVALFAGVPDAGFE
ncbi:MAG: hypothetical protein LBP86_00210 [Azoarcus sp.]|nr:hypothetical protein [Azoarcus sp.]